MRITYADVGRRAASVSLRLSRLAERRQVEKDTIALAPVANRLGRMAKGDVETGMRVDDPIFSTSEGQYVLVRTTQRSVGTDRAKVMGRLGELANNLERLLTGIYDREKAEELDAFFQQMHQVAGEIATTGLRANPVVELFNFGNFAGR